MTVDYSFLCLFPPKKAVWRGVILSQILLEDSLMLTKLKSIMQNCMVEES
jgi:hypothetical protein